MCIYIDNIHTYESACICTDCLRKDTQETRFSNLPPGKGPGTHPSEKHLFSLGSFVREEERDVDSNGNRYELTAEGYRFEMICRHGLGLLGSLLSSHFKDVKTEAER